MLRHDSEFAAITLLVLLSLGAGSMATAPLWVDPAHRLPANADVY
jgi:hypothetical protein